jgi:predicted lipid-binding transport protein (Tim44 family)
MNGGFIDIIIFGVVAIFLIMRLKNILGSSQGKIINIQSKKTGIIKPNKSKTKKIINDDEEFLVGANHAFSMIVNAYQENNITKVQQLLTPDALKILSQNKAPDQLKFMNVKASKVLSSSESNNKVIKLVQFEAEHYDLKSNEQIIDKEEWGFEKEVESNDPNWKLFSIKVVT